MSQNGSIDSWIDTIPDDTRAPTPGQTSWDESPMLSPSTSENPFPRRPASPDRSRYIVPYELPPPAISRAYEEGFDSGMDEDSTIEYSGSSLPLEEPPPGSEWIVNLSTGLASHCLDTESAESELSRHATGEYPSLEAANEAAVNLFNQLIRDRGLDPAAADLNTGRVAGCVMEIQCGQFRQWIVIGCELLSVEVNIKVYGLSEYSDVDVDVA